MTTDPEAAPGFYQAITGWSIQDFDGGPTPYQMWTNGDVPLGGLMQLPEEAQPREHPRTGWFTSQRQTCRGPSRR